MYDPFDRRTLASAATRFDARLRHCIAENIRPRSLVTFPCPYSGKRISVQRGGPSPTHAPSPATLTCTTHLPLSFIHNIRLALAVLIEAEVVVVI